MTREFIRSRVRSRLLSSPFPAEHADLSEIADHTKLRELIEGALARTQEIKSVIAHWDTARLRHGIDYVIANRLREECARDGFFASAVDAISWGNSALLDQCSVSIGHQQGFRENAPFLETWLEGVRAQVAAAASAKVLQLLKPFSEQPSIDGLLEECGVSDLKRAAETALPELISASVRLEREYKQRPDLTEATCQSKTFYLSIIPYAVGRDDGLRPEHEKMHEFIRSLALRNRKHMGEVDRWSIWYGQVDAAKHHPSSPW